MHRKRIFARWVAHDVEERTGVDAQHWHAFRSHGRDVERKHGSASLGFPIEEFLAALIFACKAVGAILVPAFDLVKPAGQTIGADVLSRAVSRNDEVEPAALVERIARTGRSEEHTSELQSLMRISYAVFCLKKKNTDKQSHNKQYK